MAKIDAFFHVHNLSWMTPVMAFFLAYGAVTKATTWILGPSKGLLEVADEGYLPKYWAKTNKNEMPTGILIIQASCSTVLSCVILVMPSVSTAFWIMTALTAQIYAVMYLFMFAAAIKLKFSQPDVPRPYRVFGGKPGICIVAGLGFLSTILCFAAGFIAPEQRKARLGDVRVRGFPRLRHPRLHVGADSVLYSLEEKFGRRQGGLAYRGICARLEAAKQGVRGDASPRASFFSSGKPTLKCMAKWKNFNDVPMHS